jgi:hypothetical protein
VSEYIIPVPSEDPDTKFSVVLDNRAYDIRMQWNGRDQAWYMYLAITNNTPFMKVKLKTNTDLLRPYLYNSLCPKLISDSSIKYLQHCKESNNKDYCTDE